jgi:uncharacterized membrane protein YgaE (UPF0421/DUF939 family)
MIQSTSYNGPLPIYAGISALQAALAAGTEVTLSVPLQRAFPRNPGPAFASILALATVQVTADNSVIYVTQIDLSNSSGNSISVQVRQVGTLAGTHQFTVSVALIDLGDLVSG